MLRDGDSLVVPKTPNFVLVNGAVLHQTAITYRPGSSAKWYLAQAGGPDAAGRQEGHLRDSGGRLDRRRAIVVPACGKETHSARPCARAIWSWSRRRRWDRTRDGRRFCKPRKRSPRLPRRRPSRSSSEQTILSLRAIRLAVAATLLLLIVLLAARAGAQETEEKESKEGQPAEAMNASETQSEALAAGATASDRNDGQ